MIRMQEKIMSKNPVKSSSSHGAGVKTFSTEIGGKQLKIEVGKLANQTNANSYSIRQERTNITRVRAQNNQ